MTHHSPTPPRGFALPLVLAVAASALLLVLASASTTWRAYRGARRAALAARADMAAERGVADAVSGWLADSLRERPLADTLRAREVDAEGFTLQRVALRTAPFVFWVSAEASEGGGGEPSAVRVVRTRAERLAPPSWPVRAAVSTTVLVDTTAATIVGALAPDVTDCLGEAHGAVPAVRTVPADSLRAAWANSWSQALDRARPWPAAVAADARWRVHVIPTRDSVLIGPRTWQGLLLHEGPLRLIGRFDGRGLLVVRGTLDATAAQLTLSGAALVDDPAARVSRLGPAVVQWNRCDVAMALATIATPRAAPFHAWVGLTP
ncbi:MAG: hypothetical protein K2R93_15535 [Gemmatimonadaceae bacterium]|nr:hypothetical protein [Gemmatimonadaceae bacterium]